MAAWTPRDLTNSAFVATNLSDKDRSYALYSVNNELPGAQSRLATQESAWLAAQEASNNGPERGTIYDLKQKALDTSLSQAERDAASAQAQALTDERARLREIEYQAEQKYLSTKDYVENLQQGQSNLLAAGAVPPGVNMFAAPPGYEERSSPAAQVQDTQNPNPTPASQSEQLQNASAADTTDPSSANAVNGSDLASDQATTIANQKDPSSAEYISEADRASDAASQQIANQKDPSSAEYISEADRASDAASQTIQNQKDPSSAEYVNESDRASDAAAAAAEAERNAKANSNTRGLAPKVNTQSQATEQDVNNFYQTGDWRVRLSLAPGANYLYKDKGNEGILLPLAATNGVLFPYTPAISVNYAAHYDPFDLTHSNYKAYQYKSSSVDQVSITCDFTAQDTFEANYLLAVIHFFRSVTKMFYGQDKNPDLGTPPPLCYLTGLGSFQFDRHPLAITSFNYTLPTDVDYIRAGSTTTTGGVNKSPASVPSSNSTTPAEARKAAANVPNGGKNAPPDFKTTQQGSKEPTYVPTKMQIQISAVPIVSRNDISRRFSLREYGTGKLLRGSKNNTGGIW